MPGAKPVKKAVSKAQQALFGSDLARARAGKETVTGMSETELAKKAAVSTKKLPAKVKAKKGK